METDLLARFEWGVATGGYHWIETASGETALTPKPDRPGQFRRYRPFSKENAGLFRAFAELFPTTQDSVLDFANEYGMLGPPATRITLQGTKRNLRRPSLPDDFDLVRPADPDFFTDPDASGKYADLFAKSIWSWSVQINKMGEAIDAGEVVCTNTVRGQMDSVRATGMQIDDSVENWKAGMALGVSSFVDEGLQESMAPRFSWSTDRDRFELRLTPRSLLGALWMQLALALTDEKSFHECEVCSHVIEISKDTTGARTDARFCSDACRAQAYRDRKKRARELAEEGRTATQIAKELGIRNQRKVTATARVKSWLKNK